MGDEIQLVSDGAGLAVIGEPGAVDRFLTSQGLVASTRLVPRALGTAEGAAGATLQAAAAIAAESGRWLKMTEESARKVRDLGGLTPTKTPGISHAMIGQPGDVRSWIQGASAPGSLAATFANLGIESGVGTSGSRRWVDAALDLRDRTLVAGAGGVVTAKRIGAVGVDRATEAKGRALEAGAEGFARAQGATSKVLGGIAERAHRRRGAVGDDDTDG